jgi:Leucine-rich repeat (LRR) protein
MSDLGHNALRSLPESLGDLDALSDFLYLHDNRLRSLPSSLNRLRRLRYLNISENEFEELPECVCGMYGLIELRASDNLLTSLPESIGQLTALRELHLRNTKIASLPEAIAGLIQLRQIDLRGTALKSLPIGLATLPQLAKIDLRWVNSLEEPVSFPILKHAVAWFIETASQEKSPGLNRNPRLLSWYEPRVSAALVSYSFKVPRNPASAAPAIMPSESLHPGSCRLHATPSRAIGTRTTVAAPPPVGGR